jgi:hypothetical protein
MPYTLWPTKVSQIENLLIITAGAFEIAIKFFHFVAEPGVEPV